VSILTRRLIGAASTWLIVFGEASLICQSSAYATDKKGLCASILYTVGASVKLRAEAKAQAKSVAVLKLNSEVCLVKEDGLWSEVKLLGEDVRGWLLGQHLGASKVSLSESLNEYMDAEYRGDRVTAIQFAERLLEHPDVENQSIKLDILDRLSALHQGVGNREMVSKLQAMRSAMSATPALMPWEKSIKNPIFENWFFTKFPDTSNYEASEERPRPGMEDLVIVLNELDIILSRGGDPSPVILRLQQDLAARPLERLYKDALAEKAVPLSGRLRAILLGPRIVKLSMEIEPERPGGKINQNILASLPQGALNDPEVVRNILDNCKEGEIDVIWQKFGADVAKSRPFEFLRCLGDNAGAAFDKYKFLVSHERLREAISDGQRNSRKLSELYGRLPVMIRSDWSLIESLMKQMVDFYHIAPQETREDPRMRQYAGIYASCENIVAVNSSDRELLLRSHYRLTRECLEKMSEKLKRDRVFASNLLTKNPLLVEAFDPSIQLDTTIVKLIAKHSVGRCPYSKLSGRLSIQLIRLLASANRDCLERLDVREFSDSEIYNIVVSQRLSYKLLDILPKRYLTDPAATIQLPTEFGQWSDTEKLTPYMNDTAILGVARKWGILKLAEIKGMYSGNLPSKQNADQEVAGGTEDHESYSIDENHGQNAMVGEEQSSSEELRVWSPAKFISPELWKQLFEIAKLKRTKCSEWKSVYDAWLMEHAPGGMPLLDHMRDMNCPVP